MSDPRNIPIGSTDEELMLDEIALEFEMSLYEYLQAFSEPSQTGDITLSELDPETLREEEKSFQDLLNLLKEPSPQTNETSQESIPVETPVSSQPQSKKRKPRNEKVAISAEITKIISENSEQNNKEEIDVLANEQGYPKKDKMGFFIKYDSDKHKGEEHIKIKKKKFQTNKYNHKLVDVLANEQGDPEQDEMGFFIKYNIHKHKNANHTAIKMRKFITHKFNNKKIKVLANEKEDPELDEMEAFIPYDSHKHWNKNYTEIKQKEFYSNKYKSQHKKIEVVLNKKRKYKRDKTGAYIRYNPVEHGNKKHKAINYKAFHASRQNHKALSREVGNNQGDINNTNRLPESSPSRTPGTLFHQDKTITPSKSPGQPKDAQPQSINAMTQGIP